MDDTALESPADPNARRQAKQLVLGDTDSAESNVIPPLLKTLAEDDGVDGTALLVVTARAVCRISSASSDFSEKGATGNK